MKPPPDQTRHGHTAPPKRAHHRAAHRGGGGDFRGCGENRNRLPGRDQPIQAGDKSAAITALLA